MTTYFTHIAVSVFTIVLFLSSSCGNLNSPTENETKPSLSESVWASEFYYYHNQYFFLTDSTGYSRDGQLAWSCPIDTTALQISGDSILYGDNDTFKYSLIDTVLTIKYQSPNSDGTFYTRVFHRRQSDSAFVSNYEYTYGKEVLYRRHK